jgi:hypothetical protein
MLKQPNEVVYTMRDPLIPKSVLRRAFRAGRKSMIDQRPFGKSFNEVVVSIIMEYAVEDD